MHHYALFASTGKLGYRYDYYILLHTYALIMQKHDVIQKTGSI